MKLLLGDEVGKFRSLFTQAQHSGPEVATKKISPSGLHCEVAVWAKLHGIEMSSEKRCFEDDGYASSGSDRHKVIQEFLVNRPEIEWVDIKKFVEENNLPFDVLYEPEVLEVSKKYHITEDQACELLGSHERLLIHRNKLISFKLDGLIKFEGEYYILEIKTASKIACQKAPLEKHQLQGKCYSFLLGVKKVIWIYESREDFKHTIAFQEITDAERDEIRDKLNRIVSASDPRILKRAIDCTRCRYLDWCAKYFNNINREVF